MVKLPSIAFTTLTAATRTSSKNCAGWARKSCACTSKIDFKLARWRVDNSEIAEPGIATPLPQLCIPFAKRIQRHYNKSPNQIHDRQRISPARRPRKWKILNTGRLKHPMRLPIARIADDNGDEVYEMCVQRLRYLSFTASPVAAAICDICI